MTSTLPVLESATARCCPPLAAAPLTGSDAEVLAARFRALADPARLRLLSLVLAGDRGETCVCDLTQPLGLSQPTVSHHLKVLVEAGLLERDKRGRWAYYRPVREAMGALATVLTEGAQKPRRSSAPPVGRPGPLGLHEK